MNFKNLASVKFAAFFVLLSGLNLTLNSSISRAEIHSSNVKRSVENVNNLAFAGENIELPQVNSSISRSKQFLIANRFFGGKASWYGPGFHGRQTANGETYNQNALTAAHRFLEFGTRVKVTNLNNGRSVVVRINDRGPFVDNRVIDLSTAAADSLNMTDSGVAPVEVKVLGE